MIIIIASVPCLGIRRCILRHYTDVDNTRESHPRNLIAVFAYTLYNISFTILDAHVGNTSPIHHQTLFMMYNYVKNNSNINAYGTDFVNSNNALAIFTAWTQITRWHLSVVTSFASRRYQIICFFFAENNAFPYISHGSLQFWGHSKVFHAVRPRQSDSIVDN